MPTLLPIMHNSSLKVQSTQEELEPLVLHLRAYINRSNQSHWLTQLQQCLIYRLVR